MRFLDLHPVLKQYGSVSGNHSPLDAATAAGGRWMARKSSERMVLRVANGKGVTVRLRRRVVRGWRNSRRPFRLATLRRLVDARLRPLVAGLVVAQAPLPLACQRAARTGDRAARTASCNGVPHGAAGRARSIVPPRTSI